MRRGIIAATVLGASLAYLDATVVNIALPTIAKDLGGGLAGLQWIANGYTLTLAAFILIGGALGDRFGRRRVYELGVVGFTLASMACGFASSIAMLVLARVLQGLGGALLVPGSLAILTATIPERDRASAIGTWSGLGGLTLAIGPFVGGYLVEAVSWRLVFFINAPLAVVVLLLVRRFVPETKDPHAQPVDIVGGALAATALGGLTYALIESSDAKAGAGVASAAVVGLGALVAFFAVESRRKAPMLDLALFRHRPFGATNAVTFLVYAALGGALFLLPLQLQTVLGYTPLRAGAALLPATLIMLVLSSPMARVAQRTGPCAPMTLGPLVVAAGLLTLARLAAGAGYVRSALPGVTLLGLGLSLVVAPLTATVLAAAPPEKAGVASAVNNAVARTGGLFAVALLPRLAGLTTGGALDPTHFAAGYPRAMAISALGCVAGALVALVRVRAPPPSKRRAAAITCPLDAPTLRS